MTRWGRVGETIQLGSLYLLLGLLPFSKAAIEILFGVLVLGWLLRRCDPASRADSVWFRRDHRPLLLLLGGYLAVCALSITVSDYPSLSLRGLVAKWLEYLALFAIVADLGRSPTVVRRSVWVMAGSSLVVVFEAVAQELTGYGPLRGYAVSVYTRMTGPYENPIDLATYCMVVIPIGLAAARAHRGIKRGALWGGVVLITLCLVRTGALGAWLGLGAGLVAMMTMSHGALRRDSVMVLGVIVLCGGALLQHHQRLGTLVSRSDLGTVDREMMWRAAIGMIRDRPVLGHGVNTFMANYLDYWVGGERMPRYAHNCYLQVAAETGLVGLAAFLWLLWAVWTRLRVGIRASAGPDRWLLLGLSAGLVAFAVQAGIDTNFYALRQAALFWVLAGLAIGLSEQAAADPPQVV